MQANNESNYASSHASMRGGITEAQFIDMRGIVIDVNSVLLVRLATRQVNYWRLRLSHSSNGEHWSDLNPVIANLSERTTVPALLSPIKGTVYESSAADQTFSVAEVLRSRHLSPPRFPTPLAAIQGCSTGSCCARTTSAIRLSSPKAAV